MRCSRRPECRGQTAPPRSAAPLLLVLGSARALAAGAPGSLHFSNGDVLNGERTEVRDGGGRFTSERFGAFDYQDDEARFEPLEVPTDADRLARGWVPDELGLSFSLTWDHNNGEEHDTLNAEGNARWLRPDDDITLKLRSDYAVSNGHHTNNKQSGRLRWFHDVTQPWLLFGQVYALRDAIDVAEFKDVDLLLTQLTAGPGLRADWDDERYSRVVLAWNHFRIDLLDYDAHVTDDAPSLLVDNEIRLFDRVTLSNWVNVYFWDDGDALGVESETEFNVPLSKHIAIGLRYRYVRNGVALSDDTVNEVRIFTRIGF